MSIAKKGFIIPLLMLVAHLKGFYLCMQDPKDIGHNLSDSFLQVLCEQTKARFFVETGTFYGQTAIKAARYFDTVCTIELHQGLYHSFVQKIGSNSNIKAYHGNSSDCLRTILSDLSGPVVFWLDAHFSGDGTAQGNENTPLFEELKSIAQYADVQIILIDDIRCFYEATYDNNKDHMLRGYPTILQIKALIEKLFPDHDFFIVGDIAVIAPANFFIPTEAVKACTAGYLYAQHEEYRSLLVEVESLIARASEDEELAVNSLRSKFKCPYYDLWQALIYKDRGDTNKAKFLLNSSKDKGLKHILLDYYFEGF